MINGNKHIKSFSTEVRRTVTDWGGWFCIGLSSCVPEHRGQQRSQSSEGSSVGETGILMNVKTVLKVGAFNSLRKAIPYLLESSNSGVNVQDFKVIGGSDVF